MNIIFDLDGTVIDSKLRLYRLFQELAPESTLSFSQYWELKGRRISNETLLAEHFGFTAAAIDSFVREWMRLIEAPHFLALDSHFPALGDVLGRLQSSAELYLCTARQSRQSALEQLERMELLGYFSQVLVTEQKKSKAALIETNVMWRTDEDWMIGDTGADIRTGKSLGMKTCAVLSGFLSHASLVEYNPDRIIASAADFRL